MEKIVALLIENWQVIALGLLELIGCILVLVLKKKPVDTLKEKLVEFVIGFINSAEKLIGAGNGEAKKEAVLKAVQDWFKQNYPEVDAVRYLAFVDELIEYILTTPQKKGE